MSSITALNEGIKKFPGSILFYSHDRELVNTVANRIIEITDDGIISINGKQVGYVDDDNAIIIHGNEIGYIDGANNFVFEKPLGF